MKRLLFALFSLLPLLACAAGGSVVLTWTAPTLNNDGTALTDLASYNVYSGASSTTLTKLASVPAASTTYTAIGLTPGQTYYFAVSSVSTSEGEGAQSNTVTAAIPLPKPNAPVLTLGTITAQARLNGKPVVATLKQVSQCALTQTCALLALVSSTPKK